MAKAQKKTKKQTEVNVNWKKVGTTLSIALNVIVIGGALTLFVWYKAKPEHFLYAPYGLSMSWICEEHNDKYLEMVRANVAADEDFSDKDFSVATVFLCGQDYKTGNYVDLSEVTRDAIYKDILKARGE